jgi:hypothetical protein
VSDVRRSTPELPLIVEERPPTASQRASAWLRGRRILLAALLALAEVIVYIIQRPSLTLATVLAVLVGVAAGWGVVRLKPGLGRDVLLIVAIAQALVVLLPFAIGISLVVGLLFAVILIVALAVVAFRLRV